MQALQEASCTLLDTIPPECHRVPAPLPQYVLLPLPDTFSLIIPRA